MQAERDRLSRDIEVSSQRINTLQRQLHSQPVCIFGIIGKIQWNEVADM